MKRITESEVGIDISKEKITVGLESGKPLNVPNETARIEEIARQLPAGCVVHMEATGGYERKAKKVFLSFGHEVRIHNPCKARRLAQALGVHAKTDMVDAKFLQSQGHKLVSARVKSSVQEKLLDVSRGIQRLTRTKTNHKKYLGNDWIPDEVRDAFEQVIQTYEKAIEALEKIYKDLVRQSEFYDRYQLALSVPGVGDKLARVLASELPESLENLTPQQVSCYAGLAPLDNSSGKKNGRRHIGKGNRHIKAALYMPAVSLLKSSPKDKELYERLLAEGRNHQQAIVAIMRRLLVRVVAVLKRGYPWQENPP